MKLKNTIVCIGILIGLLMLGLFPFNQGLAETMPSPSWRVKTNMPTARSQAAVIAGDDGKIYVIGGWDGSNVLNTVQAYDPMTETWANRAPIPHGVRGAAVTKGSDGIIYVISGVDSAWDPLSNVQAYNTTSNSWTSKADIPVKTWMGAAATGNDGKIYVIGGESYEVGLYYSNLTQIYDPATDTWTNGTQMPTGRCELGVVKGPDGLIYAFGGYNDTALSVVEAYNPSAGTWIKKASMPKPKLEFGVVLGLDNRIYIIGGGANYGNNEAPFYDSVEVYDPKTDTWSTPTWQESYLPTRRKELGAAVGKNGKIYAIGGCNGAYLQANEEATIITPENIRPTAYIDSITPNPIVEGENITFTGHGTDSDGSIVAYEWRSSIDGVIGNTATFKTSTLSKGTHTIYFSVKDNSGAWSNEAVATVTVNVPTTEDPLYQELQQQNSDLTDKINGLTQKLDMMTYALLGAIIVAIVLGIATIALMLRKKAPPPPKPPTQ
ncbi:MAG: kelch repeat-containing protein [Candidatus Bathyarchaeota archaeon]|nr:hypothetical protein [Candidatus Bathyarchaeota archaeon A05DMB-5]MDH7558075.1 kelch repeat-containing protein [Candidatus Bathyarchaeota archaeon]